MKESTLRRLAPIIQKQLRESFREYKDRWRPDNVPLIDGDGNPVAIRAYEARKELDTHQIMLPLPEHEKLAIQGWMEAEAGKRFQTRYIQGRGARFSRTSGVETRYQSSSLDVTNPWKSAGEALFGKDFETKAREAFVAAQVATAELSSNYAQALDALVTTATATHVGSLNWPAASLRAMFNIAKKHGVLDRQWAGVIKEGSTDLSRIGVTQVQPVWGAIKEMAEKSGEDAVVDEINAQREAAKAAA